MVLRTEAARQARRDRPFRRYWQDEYHTLWACDEEGSTPYVIDQAYRLFVTLYTEAFDAGVARGVKKTKTKRESAAEVIEKYGMQKYKWSGVGSWYRRKK